MEVWGVRGIRTPEGKAESCARRISLFVLSDREAPGGLQLERGGEMCGAGEWVILLSDTRGLRRGKDHFQVRDGAVETGRS